MLALKADILIIFQELTLTGIGLLVNIVNGKICLTKRTLIEIAPIWISTILKKKPTLLQILLLLSQINAF